MQQSRTKEEKQELVELYKQSGMSVRALYPSILTS